METWKGRNEGARRIPRVTFMRSCTLPLGRYKVTATVKPNATRYSKKHDRGLQEVEVPNAITGEWTATCTIDLL